MLGSLGRTRAQVSVEFMVIVGLLVLLFAFVVTYAFSLQSGLGDEAAAAQSRVLADRVAEAVTDAGQVTGLRSVFSLPSRLDDGRAYSLTVYNGSVVVNWSNGFAQAALSASRIQNASGASPPLSLSPGLRYEAKNTNNIVVIRSA